MVGVSMNTLEKGGKCAERLNLQPIKNHKKKIAIENLGRHFITPCWDAYAQVDPRLKYTLRPRK